jgi:hypothetical protein
VTRHCPGTSGCSVERLTFYPPTSKRSGRLPRQRPSISSPTAPGWEAAKSTLSWTISTLSASHSKLGTSLLSRSSSSFVRGAWPRPFSWRRLHQRRDIDAPDEGGHGHPDPDAEPAWKTLGLINDWLKHAETKGAGSLAAAGVIGGILFNVIKDRPRINVWTGIAATACAVLVIVAALFAAASLWPRLRSREQPTNPLYFNHIARAHPDVATYHDTFRLLTADKDQIIREVAAQVWANAHVAHKKYRWAGLQSPR